MFGACGSVKKKIARKKRVPLEDPPSTPSSSSSSSQEDEQLTDQEEEENHYQEPTREKPEFESSKDEEEQEVREVEEKVEKTKPSVKKPITPANPQSPDSDPGFDSETHLGSLKPTSCKRLMQEFEKTANQSQKKKKAKVVVEEEEKKSVGAINRLWSEEDEVLLLKGLIDFQSKNGSDTYPDMENDGKESALGDENKNGVDGNGESNEVDENGKSSRSKRVRKIVDRERHLPEGNGKEGVALGEELKGGKLKDMEVDEVGDFWAMHPCLKGSLEMETETGMPSDLLRKNPVRRFLKENMSTIGNEKAMELEKKWKNLHAGEVVLSLKRGGIDERADKAGVGCNECFKGLGFCSIESLVKCYAFDDGYRAFFLVKSTGLFVILLVMVMGHFFG
ncbi:hypothetical protein RHMOL_Rhmol11G0079900 [Rhododendron molle]|uniref:Uncharacterized protein n=1 Tax=Rhododendron molle TaxID=49168 RepID=A0ACC0LPZ9_RHOML|nr:hypothetical protein RHMOL_Rhmol11G0079900 [Rhododendron molle]